MSLSLFLAAALGVAITPGVGSLYVFTRTLEAGWRIGLLTVLGTTLGGSAHVTIAAFGGAAILGRDPAHLRALSIGGALYLAYLGLRGLMRRPLHPLDSLRPLATIRDGRALSEGFLVALSNPTTAIFLLAFLPQFVDPNKPPLLQLLGLGSIFVGLNAGVHLTWVFLGARADAAAARWPRLRSGLQTLGSGVLVAIAASSLWRAL